MTFEMWEIGFGQLNALEIWGFVEWSLETDHFVSSSKYIVFWLTISENASQCLRKVGFSIQLLVFTQSYSGAFRISIYINNINHFRFCKWTSCFAIDVKVYIQRTSAILLTLYKCVCVVHVRIYDIMSSLSLSFSLFYRFLFLYFFLTFFRTCIFFHSIRWVLNFANAFLRALS